MISLTLRLELTEPYQASSRALDAARKMGFQLVRMKLDCVAGDRHRMDLGLRGPTTDRLRWDCLFHRLEGTPGIGKVRWGGAARRIWSRPRLPGASHRSRVR